MVGLGRNSNIYVPCGRNPLVSDATPDIVLLYYPDTTQEDLLCSVRTGCQRCVDVSCSDLSLTFCFGGRLVRKKTYTYPGGKNYHRNRGKLKIRLESPIFVERGSSKILALPLQLTFLFMKLTGIINQWTLPAKNAVVKCQTKLSIIF